MKERLLMVWWYDRFDLVGPLLPALESFEVHWLFYRFRQQEELLFDLPGHKHYWVNYSSAYRLLKKISPAKVVFISVENLLSLSLLSAARNLKIKTFYLAHGITTTYKFSLEHEDFSDDQPISRYQRNNPFYKKRKLHTCSFFFYSFFKANLSEKIGMLKFIYSFLKHKSVFKSLYKQKTKWRLTDYYIVFTKHTGILIKERDGIDEANMIEVGPYILDKSISELLNERNSVREGKEKFWLLIDQPLITFPDEVKLPVFKRVADLLKSRGCRLFIKLHPIDYNKDELNISDNITYIKQTDQLSQLINDAEACIGFYSTLLLPIIWKKPTALFKLDDNPLVDDWLALKVVSELNIKNLSLPDLEKVIESRDVTRISEFEKMFLLKADGKSVERVKKILTTY